MFEIAYYVPYYEFTADKISHKNVGWKIFAYFAPTYSNPYLHPSPFLFLLHVYEFISLWTWKFGNVQFSKKLRGKCKNPE